METNRLLDRFKPFFRKPKKFNAYFTDCSFCADTIIDHLKLKGFKVAEIVKDSNLLRSINKDLYTFYFEDGYGCNIRYSDSINVLQNKPVYFSLFLIRDQLPLFIKKYNEDVSIQLVFTEPFWLEKRGQLLECILKYLPGLKPSDIEIAYDTDFQKSPSAALRLVWKKK
jgi:hypothetical protein